MDESKDRVMEGVSWLEGSVGMRTLTDDDDDDDE